jgi:Flp pilus assembly protein TadD
MQDGTFESKELFNKAEASIRRGNFGRAAKFLRSALKIDPENPVYLSHLGLCIGLNGNKLEGEEICRKAVELSSRNPVLLVNLGRILVAQNRRREAWECFTRAYKMDNTNAPAALELSRMGVRKKPMLPFLSRNHPLNIKLGIWRHKLREYHRRRKEENKI